MLPDLDHDRILATVPVNVSMPTEEPLVCPDTDTLVVSYGHQSVTKLSDALADWEGEIHSIGDALSPRTAEEAILDGLKVASLI